METQQHHQHAHAATTQAASKPIDIPGQTHAAATAHAASGPRGLPLGPGPKRLRSGLPTVDSSPAGVGAVRQELLGSPHLAGLSPIAAMALVQTSFVSPPTSPPDDLELEYHQLMWRADQQAGNAPCGTPPHRPPCRPRRPRQGEVSVCVSHWAGGCCPGVLVGVCADGRRCFQPRRDSFGIKCP